MKLDKEALASLIKLLVFFAFTGAATLFLAMLLANISFQPTTEYRAVFEDVTGVAEGDDVRIAGVAVGSVSGVEVLDRNKAILTFAVNSDVRLTENTNAELLFRNLVGQRYLSLTQGSQGAKSTLKAGAIIPLERTDEALDLNVLFSGFKPVFEGLSPEDTNKLAFEIIKTLQGETGSIETLLGRTASLTNTLAERDELIGDVITNLSDVLDFVGDRDDELTNTIDTLQQFATGLKEDRNAILNSIDSVSDLAVVTADLLDDARPIVSKDLNQLRRLTDTLSEEKNKKEIANAVQVLPLKMKKIGNAATYGTAFNFYLCDLRGEIVLPAIPPLLPEPISIKLGDPQEGIQVNGGRCNLP